mgnify:CR=1 FL=1
MAKHTQNEIALENGAVRVYQRDDVERPLWHCRIKLPNRPYVRRSLKTHDRAEAIAVARELYADLRYKAKRGQLASPKTFSEVARELLRHMDSQVQLGKEPPDKLQRYRQTIDRYLVPFFGKTRIDSVTPKAVQSYRQWRETYWLSGPGSKAEFIEYERNGKTVRARKAKPKVPAANRLAIEDTVLRQVFGFAKAHGYVSDSDIPEIKSAPQRSERRPAFTLQGYRKLFRTSQKRMRQAQDQRVREQRQLLHDFVLIMVNSGLRPVEAHSLRWRDIEAFKSKEGRTYVRLWVRGKGKKRETVPMTNTRVYLNRIKQRRQAYAAAKGQVVDDSEQVFAMSDGTRVQSFKRSFEELLKAAGLTESHDGKHYTPYSLRHTYATFRLLYGRVSIHTLAVNMGTSVEMIERHYSHVTPALSAEELTTMKGSA